ncbi:MAG: hypothetical protein DMG94_03135, partial [Acidobacteria bacterium]
MALRSPADGFGAISDMSTGFRVEKSLFSSGTLTFNGDVGYGASLPNAIVRTSFKHQIANGSTPEIAFTMRRLGSPLDGEHNAELQSLAMSMADNISLGDVLEFGSVSVHLSPNTKLQYSYATSRPDSRVQKGFESAPADLSEADPRVSIAGFAPALERAHH